ncbi:MAG TPA: hypothetical protein ENI76_06040 [Ignavibacteria bacterium]|nr:hypothetical protein [Ignavibacteria bacterium]
MEISFTDKEKSFIKFFASLNSQKNKEILIRYLIQAGIKGVSKKLQDIPNPVKNILNEILKEIE